MRRVNKKGKTVKILSVLIFAGIVFAVILFNFSKIGLGAPLGGGANCQNYSIAMIASPTTGPAGSTFGISADASNWIGCICSSQGVSGTTWALNFGDGTSYSSPPGEYMQIFQNHVYTSSGTQTPTASLELTCGNISIIGFANATIKVTPSAPSINATNPSGSSSVTFGGSATYSSTFSWEITNATVGIYQYSVDGSGNTALQDSCSSPTTTSPITKSCSFSFNNASATSYKICAEGTSQ